MEKIIIDIIGELKANVDEEYKKAQHWFFKEEINFYGVSVGMVRKIGRDFLERLN